MKNNLARKIFPTEEAFREIYYECLENEPMVSNNVINARGLMNDAFDEYIGAVLENAFRYYYQCGYEAAIAKMQKGGAAE